VSAGAHRATRDPARGVVAYLVGARPNYVKMAPLIRQLRGEGKDFEHVLIDTGQHYDRELSEIFVEELQIGPPDYELGVGSGTHAEQTARAMERVEAVLNELQPLALVVPGDVNSTLAGALAASKLGIPIAHLEAGLRSFDRSMPEEINRVLTDQLSTWCFTHSPEAEGNLVREGVAPDRVFFVGNTMIDTLVRMQARVESSDAVARLGLVPGEYLLVTLHRPKLVDGDDFGRVVDGLARLSQTMPVVFPVHPRTRRRLGGGRPHPASLMLIEPVGYVDFLALEAGARAVLTDSGGIQEETTFLQVPCFTMRDNTERPVTIESGTNRLIGTRPEALASIPAQLEEPPRPGRRPEGWDGRAAERAASVLLADLRGETRGLAEAGR
jgi:UDP-N-acetylglucosamine 2-epimerase (non-hydrolysing)